MIVCDGCGVLISRYATSNMGTALCPECRNGHAVPHDELPVSVYLACTKEWIDERTVTPENIEEDLEGRDVLTFQCPHCRTSHRSFRRGP